jgi:hypothetical protein
VIKINENNDNEGNIIQQFLFDNNLTWLNGRTDVTSFSNLIEFFTDNIYYININLNNKHMFVSFDNYLIEETPEDLSSNLKNINYFPKLYDISNYTELKQIIKIGSFNKPTYSPKKLIIESTYTKEDLPLIKKLSELTIIPTPYKNNINYYTHHIICQCL